MEFTLRYIVDYKRRRITKDRLFTRILEEVDQTNGRVAERVTDQAHHSLAQRGKLYFSARFDGRDDWRPKSAVP